MRPAVRRKLLMHSYRTAKEKAGRPGKGRKGKSLMPNEIEIATTDDGVVRVLTAEPQVCGICGEARTLFISRHGRTRCYRCDEGFEKAEAAMRREQAGLPA